MIVDKKTGEARLDLMEDLADYGQALTECFYVIAKLAGGDPSKLNAVLRGLVCASLKVYPKMTQGVFGHPSNRDGESRVCPIAGRRHGKTAEMKRAREDGGGSIDRTEPIVRRTEMEGIRQGVDGVDMHVWGETGYRASGALDRQEVEGHFIEAELSICRQVLWALSRDETTEISSSDAPQLFEPQGYDIYFRAVVGRFSGASRCSALAALVRLREALIHELRESLERRERWIEVDRGLLRWQPEFRG